MIKQFAYRNGYENSTVFRDFLRYVIHGFSPGASPLEDWRYKKEENVFFFELLQEWIGIMSIQVDRYGWCDAFGDLFMILTGKWSRQGRGQFFTPADLCDLIVGILYPVNGKPGITVNDPCCGSGRLLLAYQAVKQGDWLVAADIDYTCCLMTVCNFLIHGCVGLVVCQNSLVPDRFHSAWTVNEHLTITGIPTVRELTREQYQAIISARQ